MNALLQSDFAILINILHFLLCVDAQKGGMAKCPPLLNMRLDVHVLLQLKIIQQEVFLKGVVC